MNQKGGVGKTSTTVNLGAAIARAGKRVLLIDMDPQGHLTLHVGLETTPDTPTLYDALTIATPLAELTEKVGENLWAIRAHLDMAALEVELADMVGREGIFWRLLRACRDEYDFLLVDCPPSLGILTLNTLAACDEVFIPLQPHFLALQGLGQLLKTVGLVHDRINPRLSVTGIVFCIYDKGTRLATEVADDLRGFLLKSRNTDSPWAKARLFRTVIGRNIRLAESPSYGQSVFDYAPTSRGAHDYAALAEEVLGMFDLPPEPETPEPEKPESETPELETPQLDPPPKPTETPEPHPPPKPQEAPKPEMLAQAETPEPHAPLKTDETPHEPQSPMGPDGHPPV